MRGNNWELNESTIRRRGGEVGDGEDEQEDVMCDSASCPQGPDAAAVMVTGMAVLTTSVTRHTVQSSLGTSHENITDTHSTHAQLTQLERHEWQHAQTLQNWSQTLA